MLFSDWHLEYGIVLELWQHVVVVATISLVYCLEVIVFFRSQMQSIITLLTRVLRAHADKMPDYERVAAELLKGLQGTELTPQEEKGTTEWAHACVSVLLREVLGAAGSEPRHVCWSPST